MAIRTYETIYLGNFASLDPTEGFSNTLSENAGLLVGQTFGGPGKGNQLYNDLVNVAFNDANNNGSVAEDQGASEPMSYNLGAGTVSTRLDSTQAYSVTITYGPKTGLPPATVTLVIAQDDLGNLFVVPPISNDATAAALRAGPIQSLTINSLINANSNGLNINRTAVDLLCFGAGTRILTDRGAVAVDRLVPGDRVMTRDDGFQPLRSVLHRTVAATGTHAPVVFAPGVIGNTGELILSPQHRVLGTGSRIELMFGLDEVLMPAVALVNGRDVTRRFGGAVTYCHLVFDRHQIVFSEGAATESLHVSTRTLGTLPVPAQIEIQQLFPDMGHWSRARAATARPCLRAQEARALFGRAA